MKLSVCAHVCERVRMGGWQGERAGQASLHREWGCQGCLGVEVKGKQSVSFMVHLQNAR